MASKEYKKLGCLDVNPGGGCAFEVRAETEDEVVRTLGNHAKTVHNAGSLSSDMAARMKDAIKSVTVSV